MLWDSAVRFLPASWETGKNLSQMEVNGDEAAQPCCIQAGGAFVLLLDTWQCGLSVT